MADAARTETIALAEGLELGADGVARKPGGVVARPADVPERWDLPEKHPLRGKRVVRCVPSGMPDCTLDASGRLVPVDPQTGAPVVAVEPAEREALPVEDAGEVRR